MSAGDPTLTEAQIAAVDLVDERARKAADGVIAASAARRRSDRCPLLHAAVAESIALLAGQLTAKAEMILRNAGWCEKHAREHIQDALNYAIAASYQEQEGLKRQQTTAQAPTSERMQ